MAAKTSERLVVEALDNYIDLRTPVREFVDYRYRHCTDAEKADRLVEVSQQVEQAKALRTALGLGVLTLKYA